MTYPVKHLDRFHPWDGKRRIQRVGKPGSSPRTSYRTGFALRLGRSLYIWWWRRAK